MTYCSKCGAAQQEGAKFCTECGAPITKELTPAQETLSQEPYHFIQHETRRRKKKSLLRRWWVWAVIIVVVVGVVGKRGGSKLTRDVPRQAETIATAAPVQTAKPVPTATPTRPPTATPKVKPTKEPAASPAENTVRPEVREFLDSYEACMDEYVEFMKKYMNADAASVVSMMGDYYKILARYTEYAEKLDALDESELTNAELAYYLEVTNRVSQKLLTVGMD